MSDGFYLADETHKTITGETVELKGVLYFKLERAGFESKATKDHVKSYPHLFQVFKNENPDYVLPDSFSDAEIGAPLSVAEVAPEAEVAVEPEVVEPLEPIVSE